MKVEQYFFNGFAFYPESETFSPIQPIENLTSGVWVDIKTYQEFTMIDKPHFYVGANKDGYPCWVEIPQKIIKESAIKKAEKDKGSLLELSANKIAPLQDAVDLGIATDEEREKLRAWKEYRVEVNRVDVGLGMSVNWPVKPK